MKKNLLSWMIVFGIAIGGVSCAHKSGLKQTETRAMSEAKLPNGLNVHEFRLANGMRVLIVPNPQAPVFNYQLWVRTGSVQEVLDPKLRRAGLAHLFEHMMFRGTPKYPEDTYDYLMTSAGVNGLNATTWFDRTNYFLSLPRDRLDFAMEIEADRFQNLALNEALFKKELGAVLGELKLGKDKPGRVIADTMMATVFKKHPYGVDVIGLESDLKKFTVDEANYFYRTYYVPNNFTLLLVGDLNVRDALATVEKYFGKMEAKPFPTGEAEPEPEQTQARRVDLTHPLAQNETLQFGYRTTSAVGRDTAALEVLSVALGHGQGSILQRSLVDKGLASSAASGHTAFRQDGNFGIQVELRKGVKRADVEAVIERAVSRLTHQPLSAEDLERAKNTSLLALYGAIDSNSGIAEVLAEGLLLADSYLYYFNLIDSIKQVTAKDVMTVAAKYLKPTRVSIVFMQPEKKGEKGKMSQAQPVGQR